MEEILIPIFICVVLPVAIVGIVMAARQNEVKRKTEVMLKAIEAGMPVDTSLLSTKKEKSSKTIKQDLLEKLTSGCILTFMGTGFLVMGVIPDCAPFIGNSLLLTTAI